jgi:hypothetical protein
MNAARPFATIASLALLALCEGCCHVQPPFVPVREALYRSEAAVTNRLALPLAPNDRQFLLTYLTSGRNPQIDRDATLVDPEAGERYAGLVDLLSQESLSVTNLVADETFRPTAAFRPWLPERAVRQVVDAREEWPLQRQPYAFRDAFKRHWWIFYHERKQVTHVMVTRALEPSKPR